MKHFSSSPNSGLGVEGKGEVPDVVQRAKDAGVHTLICVGCDEQTSRQSVELASEYANVYAVVGVHPTEKLDPEEARGWLREQIQSSDKVVGIGETGIDYYHEPYDSELQQSLLRMQCEVAQEFDLPVVVHLRETKRPQEGGGALPPSSVDCLQILDEMKMGPNKVLFHCFSGDRTMLDEVLKREWMISLSGVVTYPTAKELQEVAKACPLDRMVMETDCPFLPPQEHRGERNEPAYTAKTARFVADLRAVDYEVVDKVTDENAKAFFALP